MKTSAKWTFVLLVLVAFFTRTECLTYINDIQHYSILFGEEWEYIDQSSLKQAEDYAYERSGQMNRYTVGFKLKGNSDFEHPYILIKELDRKSASMKDIEALFNANDYGTAVMNKYPRYRDILDNVSLNKPFADKEKSIIYTVMSSDVENIGKVSGLTAMIFGRESIAAVYCYAMDSTSDMYYKEFVGIIESCTFEPNYRYSGMTKAVDESGITQKGGWLLELGAKGVGGFIAGASFALIAMAIFFFSWLFKKKPKPHSYGEIDYAKISIDDLEQRLISIRDINEANNLGITALMIASASTTDIEKIKLILEKGAEVNQLANDGMSAFIYASGFNANLEIVRLFRNQVSNIDQKTNKGRTALSYAAECNRNTDVVEYLIDEGADVNSQDTTHRTPLIWACATGEFEDNILLLIDMEATLDTQDNNGYTAYKHIKGNVKLKHSKAREALKELEYSMNIQRSLDTL